MRCKPGDLAVVTRGHPAENVGKLITVTNPITSIYGTPSWEYEGYLEGGIWSRLRALSVADSCLRPIRPGDLDESTTNERSEPCQPSKPVVTESIG